MSFLTKNKTNSSLSYKKRVIGITIFSLVIVFLFSLFLGRYWVAPQEIFNKIIKLISGNTAQEIVSSGWRVFYFIRLPRLILVIAVGAALSVTGAVYQSIFHNPLVSPNILGVSAGAGFGVALGLLLNKSSLFLIYGLSFLFGILAVAITYYIAKLSRGQGVMKMVLAGIVVSSLFNALLSILKYMADPMDQLPGIVFWLMGGFHRAGWREVKLILPFILIGIIVIFFMRWYLNVMSMGDEEAASLGVNVKVIRLILISFSTIMVAAAVATTGQITWIGLVIPHISRFLVGSDHKMMIPQTIILGPTFLLLMDDLARTLTPAEIPISIITAFVGAPFFAYLLMTRSDSGWS